MWPGLEISLCVLTWDPNRQRCCVFWVERWELVWRDRSGGCGLDPRCCRCCCCCWCPWRQPGKSMTGREAAAARPQCGGGGRQARTQFRPKATQCTLASNTSQVISMSSSSARRHHLARSPLRPEGWDDGVGWDRARDGLGGGMATLRQGCCHRMGPHRLKPPPPSTSVQRKSENRGREDCDKCEREKVRDVAKHPRKVPGHLVGKQWERLLFWRGAQRVFLW